MFSGNLLDERDEDLIFLRGLLKKRSSSQELEYLLNDINKKIKENVDEKKELDQLKKQTVLKIKTAIKAEKDKMQVFMASGNVIISFYLNKDLVAFKTFEEFAQFPDIVKLSNTKGFSGFIVKNDLLMAKYFSGNTIELGTVIKNKHKSLEKYLKNLK